jgi:hypothetical protein
MGIAWLINEMSRNCISVTDSAYCINQAILYSGSNYFSHISEVLNSPDEQIKQV